MKGCNALLKSYLQSWKKSKWRQKKKLWHLRWVDRLSKANKAVLFSSGRRVIWTFDVFFSIMNAEACKENKTMICHVWKCCKDLITSAHLLFSACLRMNSPTDETNRFLMVSFLMILLRSLRGYILRQLFTPGSVNIDE